MRQIEGLIALLPGVGSSEGEQEERIRVLEGELQGWLGEREEAEGRRLEALGKVEGVLQRVKR